MSSIRAFLAANLPVSMIEEVRGLQDRLREQARADGLKVAWVPPPNMHVTIKFLGQVLEETVAAIPDRLQDALQHHPTIHAEVTGLGVFPSPSKPRVLWVGVRSVEDALAGLAGRVDAALEELGFEPETRPFHAHLTLGRVKQGGSVQQILDEHGEVSFGHCSIHELVLYKSVLQQRGAEYSVLGRVPLGG